MRFWLILPYRIGMGTIDLNKGVLISYMAKLIASVFFTPQRGFVYSLES